MKKYFILIVMLILLCGCTINYDLEFQGDNTFFESISGTVENKELEGNLKEERSDISNYMYAFSVATPLIRDGGEYNKKVTEKEKYKEFEYTYTYKNNYKDSNVVNTCYDKKIIEESEDFYFINLTGDFKCMYSDKIVVNLISDYVILKSNADEVKENNHTWIIKNENDSDISVTISKKNKYQKPVGKASISIFKIVISVIFVVLTILTVILYKRKNSN